MVSSVVTLKSISVRDHVISKKREKGNLTVRKVLALDQPGNFFVREFLLSATYGLLWRLSTDSSTSGCGLERFVFVSLMGPILSHLDLISILRNSNDLILLVGG